MQLPYFFTEDLPAEKQFTLPEETGKHCIQVLRMQAGEQLILTNGKGNLLTATILVAERKNCLVKIDRRDSAPNNRPSITIAISLLKNAGRFEWFLEKAAEIGINEIIPLTCKRTEKQYFRKDRMRQILVSAMLQSRQSWLPLLREPVAFEKVVTGNHHILKLIAHCDDDTKQPLSQITPATDAILLIGPEGDFTPDEIQFAIHHNFTPVSLGDTRLRTETAGIVAASLLKYLR